MVSTKSNDETGENTEEADEVEDDDDGEEHFEPMASSDDPEGVQSATEDTAEDLNGSLTDVSFFFALLTFVRIDSGKMI